MSIITHRQGDMLPLTLAIYALPFGSFMGIFALILLFVLSVILTACVVAVTASFKRCHTIPSYRLIAILSAILLPLLLIPLLLYDIALHKPPPSPLYALDVASTVLFSRTSGLCFLGASLCLSLSLVRFDAVRRFSAVSWGFLISFGAALVTMAL
jgi:hypothetical protein